MRIALLTIVCSTLLLAPVPCFGLVHPPQHQTHATVHHASLSSRIRSHFTIHRKEHATVHHEAIPAMAPERATQIQSALIKSGYMDGQPTGTWDAGSITAMQKLQADNGWQTRLVPDSRALIKLGLGPQQDN